MNKRVSALLLTGVLACSLAAPATASSPQTTSDRPPVIAPRPTDQLADSVLYYGTITALEQDEAGKLVRIQMESERYGAYAMNISDTTVFVDSGNHSASDPKTLAVGERVYVYHSPMSTRSLPPQSAAFAVVRNLPMDTAAAHYQQAEAIVNKNGQSVITSENGSLSLTVDKATELKHFDGSPATLSEIRVNSFLMAWYEGTGSVHADHILLLPEADSFATRADLAQALHTLKGAPAAAAPLTFEDVSADAPQLEAIRWAVSTGLLNGYTPLAFGYDDQVTLEQAITALWRLSRSPQLMDYPGLSQYEDAGEIQPYAAPALAWAHQKQLLDHSAALLHPDEALTVNQLNQLLEAYAAL